MRKLEIVPYNVKWSDVYNIESKKLKKVFGQELLQIHHIGSTSIPGIYAKPIIDILIEIQDIRKVDLYNDQMKRLGYVPKGENGIPARRYFSKGGDNRTHHVHIFQTGSEQIINHLAFRDYLIEDKNETQVYSKLKMELSQLYPDNVKSYQEKKFTFVSRITKDALDWANKSKKTKVMAFILRQKENSIYELLSLSFNSFPNAPMRVPGGNVEDSEDIKVALIREIIEESGLTDLSIIRKMGILNYYKPHIRSMVERHDYLLIAPSNTLDNWKYKVTGGDKDSGMVFKYRWINKSEFPKIDGELRSFLTPKYIPELFF